MNYLDIILAIIGRWGEFYILCMAPIIVRGPWGLKQFLSRLAYIVNKQTLLSYQTNEK